MWLLGATNIAKSNDKSKCVVYSSYRIAFDGASR